MICPNCGKETNGKFCPQCGTKLMAEEAARPAEELLNTELPQQAEAAVSQVLPTAEPAAPVQAPPAPQAAAPNPAYSSNPTYAPNPNYAPHQGYPQNRGYVPSQGNNPAAQAYGGYNAPAEALGNTPARQLARKLATSPAFLMAVLAMSLSFIILLVRGVSTYTAAIRALDYYRTASPARTQIISAMVSTGLSVLVSLVGVIVLWSIFGTAASKQNERMSTGGLTFFKVIAIIGIVALSLLLALYVVAVVVALANGGSMNNLILEFERLLSQSFSQAGLPDSFAAEINGYMSAYFIMIALIPLLIMILALVYYGKLVKTLNTGKRVIQTGLPDDRVSPFVAVLGIIGAVFTTIGGVSLLVRGGTANLLSGVSILLGALASVCFAVLIFRFRDGMRQLGVYKGVTVQRPY